jgi:hypothetical protein
MNEIGFERGVEGLRGAGGEDGAADADGLG